MSRPGLFLNDVYTVYICHVAVPFWQGLLDAFEGLPSVANLIYKLLPDSFNSSNGVEIGMTYDTSVQKTAATKCFGNGWERGLMCLDIPVDGKILHQILNCS